MPVRNLGRLPGGTSGAACEAGESASDISAERWRPGSDDAGTTLSAQLPFEDTKFGTRPAQTKNIRVTRKLGTTSYARCSAFGRTPGLRIRPLGLPGVPTRPKLRPRTGPPALGRSDRCIHGHLLRAAGCVVLKVQDGRNRSGLARPQAQRDLATLARRQ
jgi:hypothetical protein